MADETERALRALPSVDAVVQAAAHEPELAEFGVQFLTDQARLLIDRWRDDIRAGRLDETGVRRHREIAGRDLVVAVLSRLQPSLMPVINATGVIVHTNLGRAPWPARAIAAAATAARGYSNLEYDLAAGARGQREMHLTAAAQLFGAEAALVANNCAAAVLLVLNTLAEGKETIVSRGELVEIGGSFRVPDILAKSGSILREVGTTNRTRAADYADAISDRTALLLKVHPSNFRIVGFTEEASIAELAALGRLHSLPVVEDLGSGQTVDLGPAGLAGEPTVGASLAAGADLVTFSGDKLLGGPQAGIIVGRRDLVARVRKNPLYRALRPDKVTIAALEAVFRIYAAGDPSTEIPVLAAITADRATLAARARDLADRIAAAGFATFVIEGESAVGGGSAPGRPLPSPQVAVSAGGVSAAVLEQRLRAHRPPVIVRVADDRVLVDPRTLATGDEAIVVAAFIAAAITAGR